MGSRSYRLNLIVRLLLILANACLFAFLLFRTGYAVTVISAGALLIAQSWLLILRVDRTNRVWTHFFRAVREADFSSRYSFPAGASFGKLEAEYDQAMQALRASRLEKERQYQYLQEIAGGLDTGLAVFTAAGEVDFSNEAWRSLRLTGPGAAAGDLARLIGAMKNGEKRLVPLGAGADRLQLVVTVKDFILFREKFRLAAVQNIARELDETEADAWQKLARVLTHEIMNSVAPISSLAATANALVAKILSVRNAAAGGAEDAGAGRDAASALSAIERRSQGLLTFVENYRKFLGIPKPVVANVPCRETLDRVRTLFQGALEEKKINWQATVEPPALEVRADGALLEQVLINLVKNSIEALAGARRPFIRLAAYKDPGGRTIIEAADNGRGISAEDLDKVFIPFFTTKPDGTGLGLAVCRQIMRLHRGTMAAASTPGGETVFRLVF